MVTIPLHHGLLYLPVKCFIGHISAIRIPFHWIG